MSWTYSGNPAASPVDEVHYRLGDVNPAHPIATDEECAFAYREYKGNAYLAAAAIAETKGMEFLYRPSTVKRADRTTSYDNQAEYFFALARQLRQNAAIATTAPYMGGLSTAEHASDARDFGLTQPVMTRHLHEPGHGRFGVGFDIARED